MYFDTNINEKEDGKIFRAIDESCVTLGEFHFRLAIIEVSKGAFNKYVDRILLLFDPFPSMRGQFL